MKNMMLTATRNISKKDNVEFGIKQKEKKENWTNKPDKEKIMAILENTEECIVTWYDDLDLECNLEKLTYKSFKELILERFGE
jgi:hypothetical protein